MAGMRQFRERAPSVVWSNVNSDLTTVEFHDFKDRLW
jgi:hypothetical protein